MTRLKQAWLALCGRLEPTIRYVPNPAEWRNYYKAEWTSVTFGKSGPIKRTHAEYFQSCQQAHEFNPGVAVTVVIGFEIDGKHYIAPGAVKPIEVQPKPKITKGARK
jgi:hypothetical protein